MRLLSGSGTGVLVNLRRAVTREEEETELLPRARVLSGMGRRAGQRAEGGFGQSCSSRTCRNATCADFMTLT